MNPVYWKRIKARILRYIVTRLVGVYMLVILMSIFLGGGAMDDLIVFLQSPIEQAKVIGFFSLLAVLYGWVYRKKPLKSEEIE